MQSVLSDEKPGGSKKTAASMEDDGVAEKFLGRSFDESLRFCVERLVGFPPFEYVIV